MNYIKGIWMNAPSSNQISWTDSWTLSFIITPWNEKLKPPSSNFKNYLEEVAHKMKLKLALLTLTLLELTLSDLRFMILPWFLENILPRCVVTVISRTESSNLSIQIFSSNTLHQLSFSMLKLLVTLCIMKKFKLWVFLKITLFMMIWQNS